MDYENLMRRALELAQKAQGFTEHYPMVGALVLKGEKIIAQGYFEKPGEPHAEVKAIKRAGAKARGATLVLNLEPCAHWGRTPPCADFVIRAGIKKVVAGMKDPNPLVSGRGFQKLRQAGVEVISGILEKECRRVNRHFVKYITTRRPWVILKLAVSADGRIADRFGESKWITSKPAREYVHQLRSQAQVVMVGIGTVFKDDPKLNVRLKGNHHQPIPLIVDTRLRIPLEAKVLKNKDASKVMLACGEKVSGRKKRELEQRRVQLIPVKTAQNGFLDLKELMKKLGELKIARVLCEGGAELASALLEQGLVDEVQFFYAPKLLVDEKARTMLAGKIPRKLAQALPLYQPEVKKIGSDFLLTAFLKEV